MANSLIIKKSNRFVEGIYNVNLWEMRVILIMLSLIKREDKDFQEYTLDLKRIKKEFGLDNDGSAYQRIKEACDDLLGKQMIIRTKLEDGTMEESKINLITDYTRNLDKKTYIKISFHPKMKPYLLQLKTEFLKYDLKDIIKLPTPYAIRIYELTKQYQTIGKRIISLAEIKKMLMIADKYKQYSHLRTRILEPAVKQINKHTDIQLSFKEIKEGRKVAKVEFTIRAKDADKVLPTIVQEQSKDTLLTIVSAFKVTEKTLTKWRKKYSDQHILDRIKYMKKQVGVNNPAAYLLSILDKDITKKEQLSEAEVTKRVNGILFSNVELESQIRAKYGNIGQEMINKIIKSKYPDKFEKK